MKLVRTTGTYNWESIKMPPLLTVKESPSYVTGQGPQYIIITRSSLRSRSFFGIVEVGEVRASFPEKGNIG